MPPGSDPAAGAEQPIFVVHVIHHLRMGGMENGVVNLVNGLPWERFRHAVICIEDSSDFAQRIRRPDVPIYEMRRSVIGVWRLRWRLWWLLRRLRPQLVHTRNMSGLDALLPARLAGSNTLHSEHGFDVDNLHGQARKHAWLRRLHAPLAHGFVAVSEDLRRLMVARWGVPAGRVEQIYNGVDLSRFEPVPRPRRDLLPPALVTGDGWLVGTVGRLQAVKDQATLLRALAEVLQRRPSWRERLAVAIVGEGPMLSELQTAAAALGVADRCWFTGARDDVPALMRCFDLFVLPSLNEGISNTVLEALASGLPVLATAVGGNVELVPDGEVGATFAPGDAQGLAALMLRYLDDVDLRRRHGEAARRRALQLFSLPAMVSAYARVYERLSR